VKVKKRDEVDAAVKATEEAAAKKKDPSFEEKTLLPSGSTLLNLALSDSPHGAYMPGSVVNIVGDSSSGKTFLAWSLFAELANNPKYDEYELIYDEPEVAFYMNIEKLFRINPDRVTHLRSTTIQQWLVNVVSKLREKRPCIYCLDSFDAVGSDEERDRFDKLIKKGEESGSYKTEKARSSGELFRNIVDELEKTRSLLVVISQTRDNIGVMFGEKKTRSGGNALRFYSIHEYWLHVAGHIKRRERDVGVNVRLRVKKNKLTGKLREVFFPIIFDYGVDDITSCVDWLIEEKFWGKSKQIIDTCGDFENMTMDGLIGQIESSPENISKLKEVVGESWAEIEKSISTDRKPKY